MTKCNVDVSTIEEVTYERTQFNTLARFSLYICSLSNSLSLCLSLLCKVRKRKRNEIGGFEKWRCEFLCMFDVRPFHPSIGLIQQCNAYSIQTGPIYFITLHCISCSLFNSYIFEFRFQDNFNSNTETMK